MAAQHLPRDLVQPSGLKELAQSNNDEEIKSCTFLVEVYCFVDLQGELRSHRNGETRVVTKDLVERCKSRPELNGTRRYKRPELKCAIVFFSNLTNIY